MKAFQVLVENELARARSKHPGKQHSRHEGIAVLEEEFLEARTEVFTDGSNRALLDELVQVAAMAQRMAEDLELSPNLTLEFESHVVQR